MLKTQRLCTASPLFAFFLGVWSACPALAAETPNPEQALRLRPVQADVVYDSVPQADYARCRIEAEVQDGKTGWVVYGPQGKVLRRFIDTNKDKVVDQWSYYRNGVEVYRDFDSNFNKKAEIGRASCRERV